MCLLNLILLLTCGNTYSCTSDLYNECMQGCVIRIPLNISVHTANSISHYDGGNKTCFVVQWGRGVHGQSWDPFHYWEYVGLATGVGTCYVINKPLWRFQVQLFSNYVTSRTWYSTKERFLSHLPTSPLHHPHPLTFPSPPIQGLQQQN